MKNLDQDFLFNNSNLQEAPLNEDRQQEGYLDTEADINAKVVEKAKEIAMPENSTVDPIIVVETLG